MCPHNIENINADRVSNYISATERFSRQHKSSHQGCFFSSTDHFELIDVLDYVPNRLVIYPTSLLHSAFIEYPEKNSKLDPKKGRFTVNTFISFSVGKISESPIKLWAILLDPLIFVVYI